MGIKYIVLYAGYVETRSAACLILKNQTGEHLTRREALGSLASGVFQKYLREEYDFIPRKYRLCCTNTTAKTPEAKFCTDCGMRFGSPPIKKEEFIRFFSQLCYARAEDWGANDIPGWNPWNSSVVDMMKNATVDEIVLIEENGAEVVTEFLSTENIPEEHRSMVESWKSEYVRVSVQSFVEKELSE